MVICIECRYPVKTLYTTHSKADDRALGKGVRLTQCPRCKRFADKYVEHDFVVLFIDLVLIKPQVYRHLLFNRLGRDDDRFEPSIIRLGILLLLFDVYLTWARIEKASPPPLPSASNSAALPSASPFDASTLGPADGASSLLSSQPLVLQYFFFLALVFAETVAFHLPIRLLCSHAPTLPLLSLPLDWLPFSGGSSPKSTSTPATSTPGARPHSGSTAPDLHNAKQERGEQDMQGRQEQHQGLKRNRLTIDLNPVPYYPHPTPLSTALIVSSCTKLFPILLIIWDYDLPLSASAVSWAVIVNNIAALEILMNCGYVRASLLVAIGAACRAMVAWLVLRMVGLGGAWAGEGLLAWGGGLVRGVI